MMKFTSDTICAISTPKGKGAIAIVRISGVDSIKIVDAIFRSSKILKDATPASIIHGEVIRQEKNNFERIDDVLVAIFKKPNSYTGEDLVEINCHGGLFVVQEILNLLLENGARLAEQGEFTKRAFLNGKIDLLQAESVADVIDAQTKLSLKYAQQQLSGVLSERLFNIKEQLKAQLELLEIEIDFSEEDITFVDRDAIMNNIDGLLKEIEQLILSFKFGKIIREGVHIVLTGKPNVGKSSILNRLLEDERAIVSEIPGTTRDVIEESLDIDGLLFRVSDTAGICLTEDFLELKGVEKTKKTLQQADQVIFIVDASKPADELDFKALDILKSLNLKNLFLIINKIDLNGNKIDSNFINKFRETCCISAKTGEGFGEFKQKLVKANMNDQSVESGFLLNKVRHHDALRRCEEFILHAKKSIEIQLSSEFVAFDIRAALNALGEISGEVTTEEILNDIFSKFCIGK